MKVITDDKGNVIDIKDYPDNDKVFDDKQKDIELLNRIYT